MNEADIVLWADAFAAFVGAFDTPIQRRRDEGELAVDARERIRAWNERMREIVAMNSAATRTLEALGYEYSGGEQWKPPVTPQVTHAYTLELPDGDERHVKVFWSERDEKEGVMTHKLSVSVKEPTPQPVVEAAPSGWPTKIDLKTLRAGDRVKVTYDDAVIDEAATLTCTPAWRQGWCMFTFIDESGRSKRIDIPVEEIDGRLYACYEG